MQDWAQWVNWLVNTEAGIDAYGLFLGGAAVVPMALLGIWYHLNIKKSEGGRALTQSHDELEAGGGNDISKGAGAFTMLKDINKGVYGTHVQGIYRVIWRVLGATLIMMIVLVAIPSVLKAYFL